MVVETLKLASPAICIRCPLDVDQNSRPATFLSTLRFVDDTLAAGLKTEEPLVWPGQGQERYVAARSCWIWQ